jgi:squalene-hopene/tetraprenyl-beta-curcumene cyclase
MKRRPFLLSLTIFSLAASLLTGATAQDVSFRNEVTASMQRGIGFLKGKQNPDGSWGDPSVPGIQPALTSLAVMSLMADPSRKPTETPEPAAKGIAFLLSKQQPDGGIYVDKALATYNTSLALTALSLSPLDEKGRKAAIKARGFVIGLQSNFDEKNQPVKDAATDNAFNGGIGYTSKTTYSDLSNTHLALEALYYSKNLYADDPAAEKSEPQLDFAAAIKFVSRCQNLKSGNDQEWVSEDPVNKGGFVYRPGETKADPMKTAEGRDALRSYGSMSYAGLLSFIYADMDKKDPRISSVIEWLGKNYTVKENPGMGAQGLFYYYHTLSKALALVGGLKSPDGKLINWQQEVSKELFNKQQKDGSWTNENGRWMEKDPILVTAYSVLTLGHLYRGL